MKHVEKNLILLLVLANTAQATITPYYSIRSQGVDAARELAGWASHVNLFDVGDFYSSISITPEYSHSFKSQNINACLFDSCVDCKTITVSGSRVADRGADDWLADNFYLPTDFKSYLSFEPVIDNVMLDLNFYFGLNKLLDGLFFRIHLPLVHTRWSLDFCETVTQEGTNEYAAGYFAPTAVPRSHLLNNFSEYSNGYAPASIGDIIFDPLQYANITNASHQSTRVAELAAVLGWNFLQDERYHLGAGIRFAAPTGTRPEGTYLFEAIAGNGKHWELGAQITGHYRLWQSCDARHTIGFYCDANITHMFAAHQIRTFDLHGKPFSRYLLAARNTSPSVNVQGSADPFGTATVFTIPNAQFDNEFKPLANLSSFDVRVQAAVQADIAAQFTYAHRGFNVDVGYNFWGRSCEKIVRSPCDNACPINPNFAENTWTIKGDAFAFGFEPSNAGSGATPNEAVPLSFSESQATIHAGTNFDAAGAATFFEQKNPNIDNARFAFDRAATPNPLLRQPNLLAAAADQTRTSIQPIFIKGSDFDLVGTRGISHKLYTHFSYQWMEHKKWIPYLGFGGFVEFGSPYSKCNSGCNPSSSSSSASDCPSTIGFGSCNSNNSCATCSVSQWGLWIKGGFSFQ